MEAKLVDALPEGSGWRFEPKWDGFRCLAFKADGEVELMSKSGKPLSRYFPEMVGALRAVPAERFVLDGELTISIGGELSFDALQMRLHPAQSRIDRLAHETPAEFVVFDCLADEGGRSLIDTPLSARLEALKALCTRFEGAPVRLSPGTEDPLQARAWLDQAGTDLDGVVAKRLDEPYQPGERAMLKIKRLRTADCVVGGFRYDRAGRHVASLLLGLYDGAGLLNHVGYTSTITNDERPDLTRRLEALIEPPGFTGKAPGGPSRWTTERSAEWSPLRSELVVEVRYDHVTGDRFRHGTRLIRWRPDKAPRQCRMEQMQAPASAEAIIERLD
jgi:ATP-dependent DNA ligase